MSKTELYLETKDPINKAGVAVILTSYGRDVMLNRAIESVLGQTFKDFVLIIVDDNSPEINAKTQGIIKRHAKKDSRITYFRTATTPEERRRVSTFARNINFMLRFIKDNLEVPYVTYLPCDDYFYPDRLNVSLKYLINRRAKSCWTPIHVKDTRSQIVGKVPGHNSFSPIRNAVTILDHSCVTHEVALLDKISYPYWPTQKSAEHIAPDGMFFNRLVVAGGAICPATRIPLGVKTLHFNSIQGRAR